MAKITALEIADQLTGDEHLPIVQGADTKRVSMRAFRELITPFLQYWYKGEPGEPGAADNTYTSYAAMQDSNPTRRAARLVGDTDVPPHPDGPYSNPTQTVGGWVPQAADGIVTLAAGRGSFSRPQQQKNDEFLSVLDKMTLADRAASAPGSGTYPDVTYAFDAAVAASKLVYVPPGNYGLVGHRPQSGVVLRGAGENCCFFKQLDSNKPTVNCLADIDTQGALIGVDYSGFCVIGHQIFASPAAFKAATNEQKASASSAFFVGGYGAYAVTRSRFSYVARKVYRALEMQGNDAGNVYECYFDITGEGHRAEAVVLNGGGYSDYNFFLTQCDTWAIRSSTGNSKIRCISENAQRYTGQMCEIWAVIEAIIAPALPADSGGAAFYDEGYCNVYHTPTLNLTAEDAGKVSFAFRPFYETIYNNAQFIGSGKAIYPFAPAFYPFTVNGGRGSCAGKIETLYDESDPNRTMSKVRLAGAAPDISDFRPGWKRTVSASPRETYTTGLGENMGVLYIVPQLDKLDTLTLLQGIDLYDGLTFRIRTGKPITTINYPAGGAYSLLPTSLAANTTLAFEYVRSLGKFVQI